MACHLGEGPAAQRYSNHRAQELSCSLAGRRGRSGEEGTMRYPGRPSHVSQAHAAKLDIRTVAWGNRIRPTMIGCH